MASKSTKKDAAPVVIQEAAIELSDADDSSAALATTTADEWDFGEDAGTGFKNLSKDEFTVPFYSLLQSNSEIVKENKVEGARGGDFINTLTKQLFKTLVIQPVHIDRVIVEWYPRGSDKGKIAGRHLITEKVVQDAIAKNGGSIISTKDKPLLVGENNLVDTRYVYFNVLEDDGLTIKGFGIMGFKKTMITPLNNATSAINQAGLKAPLWSGRFVLSTQLERKGADTFHNVTIKAFGRDNLIFDKTNLLPPSHPLYVAGKELQKSIAGGVRKADFDQEVAYEAPESEDSKQARHF